MENNKPARPWDLFNKNIGRVAEKIKEERFSICQECPKFIKITGQCRECGCVMKLKTSLPHATCPIGKWGPERVSYTKEIE